LFAGRALASGIAEVSRCACRAQVRRIGILSRDQMRGECKPKASDIFLSASLLID
jgi:hypothetical protein